MKHKIDRIDEIEEQFEQADEDGDGQISLTEFRTLMAGLGSVAGNTVDSSFSSIDSDHNGRIGFAEFRAWWLRA